MQSRRDQVQAQSYVIGRLTGALVMAEPEALESPHRRVVVGHLVGVLVAALVVAGFVVYGFMRPGGDTSWRKPRTLVVEKETGARYVLVGGVLRPVLNYASAVLLLGGRPSVTSVSSASLRSAPRGLPLGIVGAPDALPAPAGLADARWTVCPAAATSATASPATSAAVLSVDRAGGGNVEERAVVVRGPDEHRYLVWRGHRHRLAEPWVAPVLGLDGPAPPVPASWLDQLGLGPDLRGPEVPGRGEPGPVIDGVRARIGTVYVIRIAGTADRYYLLQRDGLSPLEPTALALTLGHPATSTVYDNGRAEPVPLTPGALSQLPVSARAVTPAGIPMTMPALADPPAGGAVWCVRREPVPHDAATVLVNGAAAQGVAPSRPAAGTVLGITRTDRTAAAVAAAAGVGGLALAGRPGQAPGADLFLVTDAGVKFPVPGGEAATALGYRGATPTLVDPALLDLLPTGPVLEPAAARR